jgi:hypothetical protein
VVVRSGKGDAYREVPLNALVRQVLEEWLLERKAKAVEDERAWLADQELRARIGRQLNKGEQLHALRRAIFYANEGQIRQRGPEQQGEQALCLAVVVNAIIVWNTTYTSMALDDLRGSGQLVSSSEIEHISPLAHQHIHLYGHYPFDLASRPDGHRPLRSPSLHTAPTIEQAIKTPNRV